MKARTLLLVAAAAVVAAASIPSRSAGIYLSGITRSTPACGACHRPAPGSAAGFPPLQVSTVPSKRALVPGESISVTTSATGGQTASSLGGFAADASAGVFVAGTGSRVQAGGTAITHSRRGSRTWTYGYNAPAQPGLVEMFAVVNTVDNDGRDDDDDMWAFQGFDSTSSVSTPIRLFVNAAGVQPLGEGCVGSFGNTPVLGAKTSPTVGNLGFGVEVHGAPPSTGGALLLGATPGFSFDLGAIGVTGCTLRVSSILQLPLATGGGNPQRGEGTAVVPIPLANNPTFRGATFEVQAALFDPQNGRPVPVTMTNALSFTIR